MRQIERKRKKEREREREREREKERERDYVRKREREKRYIEREIKKERFRESGPLSPTLSRIYACIRTFMRMSECVSNLFFKVTWHVPFGVRLHVALFQSSPLIASLHEVLTPLLPTVRTYITCFSCLKNGMYPVCSGFMWCSLVLRR